VGHNAVIQAAVPLIRMGGSICVYGVLGAPEISFNKEKGPYNFNLFIHQWPTRAAEAAAQKPLIEWIEEGLLSEDEFVSGAFGVTDFEKAYRASQGSDSIKTMIRFDQWTRS
jgi:alcohol dehydrogenase